MDDFDDEYDDEYDDGLYDGQCQGCDLWGVVDDLGLCETCREKFERDLIRQRQWDHSAWAFGVPVEKREALRQEIIRTHGEKLELIAPTGKSSPKSRPKHH